jgi:hypothetical protein
MGEPTPGVRLHVDFDTLDQCISSLDTIIEDFKASSGKYSQTVQGMEEQWQGLAAKAFFLAIANNTVLHNNELAIQMAQSLQNDCMRIMHIALEADAQAAQMINNVIKSIGDGLNTMARQM